MKPASAPAAAPVIPGPAQDPTGATEATNPPIAQTDSLEPQPPEQPEDELAELGLVVDPDGKVTLELLTGLSGPEFSLAPKERYRCAPTEAVRLTRATFARQGEVTAD